MIGIDIGLSGAIVVINDNGKILHKSVMPIVGSEIDIKALYKIIYKYRDHGIVFEEIQTIFSVSKTTMYSLGRQTGFLYALCTVLKAKFVTVNPKKWQNFYFKQFPKRFFKKDGSLDTKGTALYVAQRILPKEDFFKPDSKRSRKAHDGIVDAYLLAYYGLKNNIGDSVC